MNTLGGLDLLVVAFKLFSFLHSNANKHKHHSGKVESRRGLVEEEEAKDRRAHGQ
jgi:hypothetical protein